MTAMMERLVAPALPIVVVTLEYKGDPDLHMYWHCDIDDTEMLHVFALCQDAELVRQIPHAREDLSPFHHHAMSFCEDCWCVMETGRFVLGICI